MVYGAKCRAVILCLLFSGVTACGGGSSTPPAKKQSDNTPLTGQILDSYIQGLRYETETLSGTTDSAGRFEYLPGETVNFFVGDIKIGTAMAKGIVTPFDFVPGAKNANDPVISNILRFLVTLDDDDNPDNGIVIPSQVASLSMGQTLDFTMTTGFDAAADTLLSTITGGNKTALVDITVVQTHIRTVLGQAVQGKYSGVYNSNSDNGNWSITVDASGTLTASSTSSASMMAVSMNGTLNDNGSFTLASNDTASSLSYQGQFDFQGDVSGTWSDGGASGTFTNRGTGGALDNSLSFYSIDFGNKVFIRSLPVQTEVIDPITRYSFYNSPDGYPATFTPNYDLMNFSITVNNPSGAITSIVFGYYNTGATSGTSHLNYNYQVVCGSISPDPCLAVTFNPVERKLKFDSARITPLASTPDIPIAATTDVIVTGSLSW